MLPRAVATISAAALSHNLRLLSGRAGVPLILPVKANAYGHGLEEVVQIAAPLPEVWGFAVALPQEAVTVARLNTGKPVLLLTPAAPEEMAELARLGVRIPIGTAAELAALPPEAKAHLKVDTGMNRLGARPAEALDLGRELARRGQLEGLYTHFASADEPDPSGALRQFEAFLAVRRHFPDALAHASNGGGVLSFGPLDSMTMARPGLASYGYAPEHLSGVLDLQPVMTLQGRVGAVHTALAGEQVSYSGLWTAPRDTRVATVQVGYADGYPRSATLQAQVWVQGERRTVLGRICMDQMMVDVTGLDVNPGDYLTLWGPQGIHPGEVARWGGVVEYELLTGLSARVARQVG
ncbi:alanine racemase [Deinococcus sonorensis]|uniref:Alanine racemase n=2 Tax=Deinococcus sonorensis TaxID=309891 RepID=A0AAU7UA24_9DEIO